MFNLIQVMAMGIGLPFRVKKKGLFGPVFMISKKAFDESGGYAPVKGEVVEDYCLGKYYSKHNISPKLFLGNGYISYRMYPLGFLSLAEGVGKKLFHRSGKDKTLDTFFNICLCHRNGCST